MDLGTNSIGWALVEKRENTNEKTDKTLGMGSRIIPMDQAQMGEFDKGNSVSQTAERTSYRAVRRLRERTLLRRERLHRVFNILSFLPEHYAKEIDFEKHLGQFIIYEKKTLSRKIDKQELAWLSIFILIKKVLSDSNKKILQLRPVPQIGIGAGCSIAVSLLALREE